MDFLFLARSATTLLKHHPFRFLYFIALLPLWLGGCGQVITRPVATVARPTPTATATAIAPTATPTATATPVPATPQPTATPTPEPTPVLYTLQAGDTLIGLARTYGVTVQAIQEANGITDPRGLLVGQQIIIPTDASARLSAGDPTPVPTPPALSVAPLVFWEQGQTLWALGEVASQADETLEDVVVEVQLLDQSDAVIASARAPIQQYVLGSGEKAGFAIHFDPKPATFARYASHIVSARPAHSAFYRRDLQVQNVLTQTAGQSVYTLTGEVLNPGPDAVRAVRVAIHLYDAAGQLIGLRWVATDPPDLQPGEKGIFATDLLPFRFPVADYHLLAEGQREQTPHD